MPTAHARASLILSSLLLLLPGASRAQVTSQQLRGAWAADRYVMASGPTHEVQGRIFFAERDWQVLFFVVDEDGEVRRGSGEGGSYELRDGQVVFTHLFNLSVGDEMVGLPASELRMVSRDPQGAPTEPTDLRIEEDVLTLHFPSGNRMIFRKR